MIGFANLPKEDQRLLETAAAWHGRLRADPALELSAEYVEWIAKPESAEAMEAVKEGWSAIGDLAATPDILELRQQALHRARRAGAQRWRPSPLRAAAALLAAAILGGAALYTWLQQPAVYRTHVGERRIAALPDGSRVSLDSETEVRVRYTKTTRALTLDHGRARFDVAHDAMRPFTVMAGTETVVAVGTSFDVERLGSKVVVTLIQGHVLIQSAPPVELEKIAKPSISLEAGEELVAMRDTAPAVAPANIQEATAWEAGHLIFRDETLAEAVARVNRYTEHPLTVGPSVASLRISGAFNAGDVGSFVSAVTSYFPVEATTTTDGRIVLERRSQ